MAGWDGFKAGLRKMPGFGVLRFMVHLARGGDARGLALLRLRPRDNLFQPYPNTWPDRYPDLFRAVRERVGDGDGRRILSFGCSTGEEVFTLRRHFARAAITGLDINPYNIALCRARALWRRQAMLDFRVAGSAERECDARYDAIFAMAVFRHGDLNLSPPPQRCDHRLRFADFETTVADLSRCLKPGGVLVLAHCHFRLGDTASAGNFASLQRWDSGLAQPLYGRDNRLLAKAAGDEGIFIKIECPSPVDGSRLAYESGVDRFRSTHFGISPASGGGATATAPAGPGPSVRRWR